MINRPAPVALMHSTAPTASLPGNPYIDVITRRASKMSKPKGPFETTNNGAWSDEEHARFVEALRLFPGGPWRLVAEYVGTRTVRQVQTHMQKINEKARRHRRGLHKKRKDRPRSEPIGSVSVVSSEDEYRGDSDDSTGAIFEPIEVPPTWSVLTDSIDPFDINDDLFFDDAMMSGLNVEGMEDFLNCLFDGMSS